jgi:hypothetical protein
LKTKAQSGSNILVVAIIVMNPAVLIMSAGRIGESKSQENDEVSDNVSVEKGLLPPIQYLLSRITTIFGYGAFVERWMFLLWNIGWAEYNAFLFRWRCTTSNVIEGPERITRTHFTSLGDTAEPCWKNRVLELLAKAKVRKKRRSLRYCLLPPTVHCSVD